MTKRRLDEILVKEGMINDLETAKRTIMAGKVRVDGERADKPGFRYSDDVEIHLKRPARFVSRGGDKLEAAFKKFKPDVHGLVCLDAGASTGGFTDCLLQHGAAKVYSVDVGRGQLHQRLLLDERVIIMDHTNVRHLTPSDFSVSPQFAVIDASFISLTKLLPAICRVLTPEAKIISLIKPQFEAERREVEPGGVIRDPSVHASVIRKVREFGEKNTSLLWRGLTESPIRGPAGNIEFLSYWEKK